MIQQINTGVLPILQAEGVLKNLTTSTTKALQARQHNEITYAVDSEILQEAGSRQAFTVYLDSYLRIFSSYFFVCAPYFDAS
jgi:hypothetical protein